MDSFNLQKNWRRCFQNSVFVLYLSSFLGLSKYFLTYRHLRHWSICLSDPLPDLSSVLWFFSLQFISTTVTYLFKSFMKVSIHRKMILRNYSGLLYYLFNRNEGLLLSSRLEYLPLSSWLCLFFFSYSCPHGALSLRYIKTGNVKTRSIDNSLVQTHYFLSISTSRS